MCLRTPRLQVLDSKTDLDSKIQTVAHSLSLVPEHEDSWKEVVRMKKRLAEARRVDAQLDRGEITHDAADKLHLQMRERWVITDKLDRGELTNSEATRQFIALRKAAAKSEKDNFWSQFPVGSHDGPDAPSHY